MPRTSRDGISPVQWDALLEAKGALANSGHGAKANVAARYAGLLGCSVPTLYRRLEHAGLVSGRKRRSDAGRTGVSAEELRIASGTLEVTTNKKGQRMPMTTAVSMLAAQGLLPSGVSPATLTRQLHARGMHPAQLALPTACLELRSLHPNHIWQIDSTTGAFYYMPGGRLRYMPEDEFYKNKVANLVKASTDLLTRYAVADHTTHAFKCRYYLGGESTDNLLDFVTWAMWKQEGSPVHGVPQMLMMDPGGANKGGVMVNFCRRVGIELRHHAAGAARVTGSVEKVHDLVRMDFETRLRFLDPKLVTIETLNAQLHDWVNAYCATRVHTRHRRTRFGAWMEILPEQLRAAASLEALREAVHREPETRRVANDLTITFGRPSREYSVAVVPGVYAAGKVTVVQNVFRAPAIDVRVVDQETGEETWQIVEPIEKNEWGYGIGSVVPGEEMRRARNSAHDNLRNALNQEAYRTPGEALPTIEEAKKARKRHEQAYAGIVDAMADVRATPLPAFLPRRGTPLDAPVRTVTARVLTAVEACRQIKAQLGDAYTRDVYAWIAAHFDAGVPEDQIPGICARFAQPTFNAPAATTLRAVGGAS